MTKNIYKIASVQDAIYKILNSNNFSESTVLELIGILSNMISENISPNDIKRKYNLSIKNPTDMFKNILGIKIRSQKEYFEYIRSNRSISESKTSYWKDCSFKFDVYTYPNIMGFELLSQYTFSSPQTRKPNSVYLHRDHMVSIAYG